MNINFMSEYPWNGKADPPVPTGFAEKILNTLMSDQPHLRPDALNKRHTIRRIKTNPPRFREGMKLVLQGGTRFKPIPFAETVCTGVQTLEMELARVHGTHYALNVHLLQPGSLPKLLTTNQLHDLAAHDGLTLDTFMRWFSLDLLTNGPGLYQIVHWTDLRY